MISKSALEHVEVLCPVGTWEHLDAALASAATGIYVGLKGVSARPDRFCFAVDDIVRMRRLTRGMLRLLVAVNNPIEPCYQAYALDAITRLSESGIDGVIVSDWGLLSELRHRGLRVPVHLSCLAGIHNSYGVSLAVAEGAERVVLSTHLRQAEIVSISRRRGPIDLEIIAAGGICLFDCYRCRLPHRESDRHYTTMCSGRITFSDGTRAFTAYRQPGQVRMSSKWCIEAGIRTLKIEGRSKSVEAVRQMVSETVTSIEADMAPRDGDGDPYALPTRLRVLSTEQASQKEVCHRESPDICTILRELYARRVIDSHTDCWLLPLSTVGTPARLPEWTGLIINDLDGPPFQDLPADWDKLQWQSPLYVSNLDLDPVADRMWQLARESRCCGLRLHDVGLLHYWYQQGRAHPCKLIWDRFGWPARAPMPLNLFTTFLMRYGVTQFEYGADQDFAWEAEPASPSGILAVPGRLAALVPPNARPPRERAWNVDFCGCPEEYLILDGLLVEKRIDIPLARRQRPLHRASELVVALHSNDSLIAATSFMRELRMES